MAMMKVVATHSAAKALETEMSKRADATSGTRTGPDDRGVLLNRNGGAVP